MTMIYWAGVIGTTVLIGAAGYGASKSSDNNKIQAKKNRQRIEDASNVKTSTGDLSKDEAKKSASKKAFRDGLFFTSPTGTLGSGSRGRSRLMGE